MSNKNNLKKWKILNKQDLPKDNRGRINHKKCNGIILKCRHTVTNVLYEIKIVDYIKGYKTNDKKEMRPKFKVSYTFLDNTIYEEEIESIILCQHLINGNIGNLIPSLNQWIKKDNYWIGTDAEGKQFKFSTNNIETEYNILHSTWKISPSNNYVTTGNLNNSGQQWQLHRTIYFNCNKEESDKNIHMCIDHINNNRTDNRIENLRFSTKSENGKNKKTNNKYGLNGLVCKNKGYYSHFSVERHVIYTKTKYDLEEAKIDNLIAQKHLGYKHNEDQFYKLEGLPEKRIEEVTDLLDKKIKNNKHKAKKEKEYFYDYIEKDNLIGIKTFKKDGTENPICWVDKDFGRIEGDKFVVEGCVYKSGGGEYFYINNNRINVYAIVGEISLQNYRNNNFHVDHINQKTNENYRDNLEIATIQSNMFNKKGKGYQTVKSGSNSRYRIYYGYNWKYFDLYIGGLKYPTFNAKEEAIAEVKRRKDIINKYRFRVKTLEELDEVINFAEEHELDIDSAYIVWKGLDTEENIKEYINFKERF